MNGFPGGGVTHFDRQKMLLLHFTTALSLCKKVSLVEIKLFVMFDVLN